MHSQHRQLEATLFDPPRTPPPQRKYSPPVAFHGLGSNPHFLGIIPEVFPHLDAFHARLSHVNSRNQARRRGQVEHNNIEGIKSAADDKTLLSSVARSLALYISAVSSSHGSINSPEMYSCPVSFPTPGVEDAHPAPNRIC